MQKGREYREDAYVGIVDKDVETESGDEIGKVKDIVINKGTKEVVLKVAQGILKSDMVIPWSKVLKVGDTVIISDRYYEGESEGEVVLK